jgi:hypothetical protein
MVKGTPCSANSYKPGFASLSDIKTGEAIAAGKVFYPVHIEIGK